jgi:hypothetical protein
LPCARRGDRTRELKKSGSVGLSGGKRGLVDAE